MHWRLIVWLNERICICEQINGCINQRRKERTNLQRNMLINKTTIIVNYWETGASLLLLSITDLLLLLYTTIVIRWQIISSITIIVFGSISCRRMALGIVIVSVIIILSHPFSTPVTSHLMFSNRAISITAPRLWNDLPSEPPPFLRLHRRHCQSQDIIFICLLYP